MMQKNIVLERLHQMLAAKQQQTPVVGVRRSHKDAFGEPYQKLWAMKRAKLEK